jgi:hypothetical protein
MVPIIIPVVLFQRHIQLNQMPAAGHGHPYFNTTSR